MTLRGRARVGLATLVTLTMVAAVPSTVAEAHPRQSREKRQLTVMTQNLYLGSSLEPAIAARSADQFVAAVAQIYGTTVSTNFPKRAEAIADTIAKKEPDLIGLQEVSRWTARATVAGPNPPSYDFLEILLDELDERGLDYSVEAVSDNANIGPVPLVAPNFGCGFVGSAPSCVVTLQDRDVILVNNDTPRLRVRTSRTGTYTAQQVLQLPTGGTASFARGWAYVDAKFEGRKFRFLNTHLEVERSGAIQEAQAREFRDGPARTKRAVIAVGDFNSSAERVPVSTNTYETLIDAGFKDAWRRTNRGKAGPTCCQNETLSNATSQLKTRIDLILTRGPVRARHAKVVGARPISETPPRWASDHAGVVAKLRLR
jgi:endonuclease/exonuclease/phosphatase family metal-dependent hydrolase